MPDREKVEEWARDFIAYADELDIARDAYRGIMEYIDDALALLREREPMEPHVEHDCDDDSWYYGCGACHEAIDYKDKYCRHCGRKVKWDA